MCFFAFPLWKREREREGGGGGIDAVIRCKKEEKTTMGRWSLLSFLSWKTTQKVRGHLCTGASPRRRQCLIGQLGRRQCLIGQLGRSLYRLAVI